METIFGEPSWMLRSDRIELALTERGAQMAPVLFRDDAGAAITPYKVSPWQLSGERPVTGSERVLRGDFFCMPFGKGAAPDGEVHPPHGATSSEVWRLLKQTSGGDTQTLSVAMDLPVRRGRVERTLQLRTGHDAIYCTTAIDGFAGATTFGHHAVLAMPEREGGMLVSSSPLRLGMTCPYPFAKPEAGETQSFAVGATFDDLRAVPGLAGGVMDAAAFPARAGCTDMLQIAQQPKDGEPAWIAAVNTEASYGWFALKSTRTLPSTVFWIENRSRFGAPWNGSMVSLGLEDVCTYFDRGITAGAARNVFSDAGVATSRMLGEDSAFTVRYVQGAVRTPKGFGRVAAIEFVEDGILLNDSDGRGVRAAVDWRFALA